jgi:hypothetical protein
MGVNPSPPEEVVEAELKGREMGSMSPILMVVAAVLDNAEWMALT